MRSIIATTIAAVLFVPLAATAQNGSGEPAAEPYQPSLSDIMAHQQERHIKLWFAGSAADWPLADYEVGELEDGFDDIGSRLGGDLVKQKVGGALAALHKAIDAKDRTGFAGAYDQLSAGCNSCHQMLDHGFIVIRRPTALPFTDQSFAPEK